MVNFGREFNHFFRIWVLKKLRQILVNFSVFVQFLAFETERPTKQKKKFYICFAFLINDSPLPPVTPEHHPGQSKLANINPVFPSPKVVTHVLDDLFGYFCGVSHR